MKPFIPERKLPTVFRHVMTTEYFRTFTFRERLKILIGYNLVLAIGLAVKHNPGEFKPVVIGKVSPHTTPDEHMREVIRKTLEVKPE